MSEEPEAHEGQVVVGEIVTVDGSTKTGVPTVRFVHYPGAQQLSGVLRGPRAPTWFLTWADVDAWDGHALAVAPVLRELYVKVTTARGEGWVKAILLGRR